MDFTNSITICQASATFCTLYKGQKFRYLLHSSRMRQNFNRIITAVFGHIFEKKKTSYTEVYSQNTKASTQNSLHHLPQRTLSRLSGVK